MRKCKYCRETIFNIELFCSEKCRELYFLEVGEIYEVPECLGIVETN